MRLVSLAALCFLAIFTNAHAQLAPGQLPFAPIPLTTNDCVKALNALSYRETAMLGLLVAGWQDHDASLAALAARVAALESHVTS